MKIGINIPVTCNFLYLKELIEQNSIILHLQYQYLSIVYDRSLNRIRKQNIHDKKNRNIIIYVKKNLTSYIMYISHFIIKRCIKIYCWVRVVCNGTDWR